MTSSYASLAAAMFASGSEGTSSLIALQTASIGGILNMLAKAPIMAVLTMGWVRVPNSCLRGDPGSIYAGESEAPETNRVRSGFGAVEEDPPPRFQAPGDVDTL